MATVPVGVNAWTAVTVRIIVGAVPALLVAVAAASILFIGLFLGSGRRTYALKAAESAGDLARALLGLPEIVPEKVEYRLRRPG